jgi:hypothetical protein
MDDDAEDTYGACATTQHPILIMPIADETFSLVHVDGQGTRSDVHILGQMLVWRVIIWSM